MASIFQLIAVLIKRPSVAAVLGLIGGLLLGLTVGWWLWPVEWTNTTPELLRPDLQEDYLRMAIDSFRLNGDPNLAVRRWDDLGPNARAIYLRIHENPGNTDVGAITAYGQVIQTVRGPIETAAPDTSTPLSGEKKPLPISTILISVAGILILAVILFGALYLIRKFFRPRSGVVTPAMQAAEVARHTERTNFQSMGLAPPVTQTMTTYMLGDDLYDESFSIDTQGGDFLGEYGVGVSETIGVGDPKKVTALEVWLFDKNDIKTATKVLMSAHAFQDANIRARLEAKGELVLIEPHKQIMLETAALQLLVTVIDLEYGVGALPPESYFERVTLELAVWPKEK